MIQFSLCIFFLVCNLQNAFAFSVEDKTLQELARDPQWLNLLHYTNEKSEVDGGDFFLASSGATDPVAELRVTLQALSDENNKKEIGPLKQSVRCAFKARYRFLSERLKWTLPSGPCEKFDQFMSGFNDPQKVSVVFSSAYTNNPASMFGHLFLKISSNRSSDLLDKGINFAAQVSPDENPFAFFYFGVFGGYEGHWSIQHYYEKINEYVKAESRDLWEYELNLSKDETVFLLEHLWELETTGITRYYFFDENCAYQIMRLIMVVKPQWSHLARHRIYAIPGEMVKNLFTTDDVVRQVKFRASLRNKLLHKYNSLSAENKRVMRSIALDHQSVEQTQDSQVLESVSSYFDFVRQKKKGELSEIENQTWQQTSLKRAKLGKTQVEESPIDSETRPDWGHDAYNLQALFGMESGDSYQGLRWQSAYHDLFNSDLGFKKFSEILFPWVEVRYRPELRNVYVEEVGLIRIRSLAPVSDLDFIPSWQVNMGIFSPKDYGCLNCRHLTWEAAIGTTWELGSEDRVFYQFLGLRAEASQHLPHETRLLPHVNVGVIAALNKKFKMALELVYAHDVGDTRLSEQFYDWKAITSYNLKKNFELRAEWNGIYLLNHNRPVYDEVRVSLIHHFR